MMTLTRPVLAQQHKQVSADISIGKFIYGLIFIFCLAAIAYLSIAFFWGKFSRAEVFFAECSREMLSTDNFITPLYHQHAFFDKPIFVYWLIIGMFKLFGINHFAARLPSVIASLVTIAITALAGSALYEKCKDVGFDKPDGRRIGLLAACMLGSAFMYLSFSSLCMSDIFLVMFDSLSLIGVYAGIKIAKKRPLCWWLASVSMGCAFLAKGPVGVVLPVFASFIYLMLTRNLRLIKINHIVLGLATIAIIGSPWFYAAYLANGSNALIYFFVHENLQRFVGSAYEVHKPFGYMIAGFFLGFAPWSILLPPAFLAFCGELRKTNGNNIEPKKLWASFSTLSDRLSGELFLWLWVFVAVGFFCISHGQCDYYTLPAYPAAAILAARYVESLLSKAAKFSAGTTASTTTSSIASFNDTVMYEWRGWDPLSGGRSASPQSQRPVFAGNERERNSMPWIVMLVALACIAITIVVGICTTQFILGGAKNSSWDIHISGVPLVAIPYFLLILTGAIVFFVSRRKYASVLVAAASGILVITILFASLILPQFNRLEPVDNIASLIKQCPNNLRLGTDAALASWNDEILFQSGKDPQRLDDLSQMRQFVAKDGPALLVAPIDKYKLSLNGAKSWHIIAGYRAVTHSLTPGYIISRKGRIVDPTPLIVATNIIGADSGPVGARLAEPVWIRPPK